MKTFLSLLLCVTLLTACAETSQSVRVERITIPASLLTCPTEPNKPAEPLTQRAIALYIVDLQYYGRACEDQLKEVRRLQNVETSGSITP